MTTISEVLYMDYSTYESLESFNEDALYVVDKQGLLKLYCSQQVVANVINIESEDDLPKDQSFINGCFYIINNTSVKYSYVSEGQNYYLPLFDLSLESLDIVDGQSVLTTASQEFVIVSLNDEGFISPDFIDHQVKQAILYAIRPHPTWNTWR